MNILIESTSQFEKDLKQLIEKDKLFIINFINYYVQLFLENKNTSMNIWLFMTSSLSCFYETIINQNLTSLFSR